MRWAVLALAFCGLALAPAPAAAATGSIAGVATDLSSDDPLEHVLVCASSEGGEEFEESCATTDAAGKYLIGGLAPGDYLVEFWPGYEGLNYLPQYYDGKAKWSEADLIHLSSGQAVTGIDASLSEGGQISGSVIDADTELPIEGIYACAYLAAGGGFGGCDETGSTGEYTIAGLASGSYEVEFWPESLNYLLQFYDGKAKWSEGDPVAVVVGATSSGIDAELIAGGRMTGTVTDAASKAPLAQIEVCAFDLSSGEFVRCRRTSSNGQYAIEGMPTGLYKVEFSPELEEGEDDGYFNQYFNGSSSWEGAEPISIGAGLTRSGIDAQLRSKSPPRPAAPAARPASTPSTSAPIVAKPTGKPKPKCRKGFRRKRIRGKSRCVRVHRVHRAKHRRT